MTFIELGVNGTEWTVIFSLKFLDCFHCSLLFWDFFFCSISQKKKTILPHPGLGLPHILLLGHIFSSNFPPSTPPANINLYIIVQVLHSNPFTSSSCLLTQKFISFPNFRGLQGCSLCAPLGLVIAALWARKAWRHSPGPQGASHRSPLPTPTLGGKSTQLQDAFQQQPSESFKK